MSTSCTVGVPSTSERPASLTAQTVAGPVQTLLEVARRHGTPAYAYDLDRLRGQIAKIRTLPTSVQVIYSLKANASLGLCSFIAGSGLGADVASAGELVTAREAGFSPERIFLSGPDKSPAVLAELCSMPETILSLDSVSELRALASTDRPYRALLRLRPDFCSFAHCSTGPDSRFGILFDDLPRCRDYLAARGVRVIGFHIFAGSQVLDAAAVIHHLRGALDQARRAGGVLGVAPEIINLGGGFGIPYGPDQRELELAPIADELRSLADRVAPARLVIELGRYIVAQAGWYLATVIGQQVHGGRRAVVIDGGVHQRGDLCGLDLRGKAVPPLVLEPRPGPLAPTDVLGCLSLPSDVLAEAASLPPLLPGDVLAFPNAGAYGLGASPFCFHGHAAPAEVAFTGTDTEVIRARQPLHTVLEGQTRLTRLTPDA
jgi:diaminopimelate decarboxylase